MAAFGPGTRNPEEPKVYEFLIKPVRSPYGAPPYTAAMNGVLMLGMRVLEFIFFAGLAGSAVVVAISFVEDFGVLIHRDR
jgi:hypothetical protein